MLRGMETLRRRHTSSKHHKTLPNSCSAYCALAIPISWGQRLCLTYGSHISQPDMADWKEGWTDEWMDELEMTETPEV